MLDPGCLCPAQSIQTGAKQKHRHNPSGQGLGPCVAALRVLVVEVDDAISKGLNSSRGAHATVRTITIVWEAEQP